MGVFVAQECRCSGNFCNHFVLACNRYDSYNSAHHWWTAYTVKSSRWNRCGNWLQPPTLLQFQQRLHCIFAMYQIESLDFHKRTGGLYLYDISNSNRTCCTVRKRVRTQWDRPYRISAFFDSVFVKNMFSMIMHAPTLQVTFVSFLLPFLRYTRHWEVHVREAPICNFSTLLTSPGLKPISFSSTRFILAGWYRWLAPLTDLATEDICRTENEETRPFDMSSYTHPVPVALFGNAAFGTWRQ